MTNDKIAEIRARHEAGAPGEMPIVALAQADADREFLLGEIDRLTRERDEARAEVGRMKKLHHPLANLPWPARGEAKP